MEEGKRGRCGEEVGVRREGRRGVEQGYGEKDANRE